MPRGVRFFSSCQNAALAWQEIADALKCHRVFDSQLRKMTILEAKSTRRKRNDGQKKAVRCIDTGAVYASCSDAADILSLEGTLINPRSILFVCQGIQKKAGGLSWEYADPQPSENRD